MTPNTGDILIQANEYRSLFIYRQLEGGGEREHLATSSVMLRQRGLSTWGVQGTPKQGWRPAPDFTAGRCDKGQARALILKYFPELLADPSVRVLWKVWPVEPGWILSRQETISDRRRTKSRHA